jgi:hypothetical protein
VKDHERIEELLAGYALLALEGDDADEADQLLSEHVPSCPTCREMLAGFRAVTGELALATPPVPPPDLTLARIRRELGHEPVRRRRRAGMVALAASVAALVGMAGLSVSLGSRATRAEEQRGTALALLNAMQQPGTDPVALEGSTDGMVEISGPDLERMYLYGRDIPDPAPGNAYQLWLGAGGTFTPIGERFRPDVGLVLLELTVDPSVYDEVLITEERVGETPPVPTIESGHTWRASI